MAIAGVALAGIGMAVGLAAPAHAKYLQLGSGFQLNGTNSPNNFSETDTLTSGTILVDGGALTLNISTATVGKSEWAVFTVQTVSGASLAGDQNAEWTIGFDNIPLTQRMEETQIFLDWGTNGTLVSPTNNLGANLPLETNPVTGSGLVFGEPTSTFVGTSLDLDAFANTFTSFLTPNGFDTPALTEFQFGALLTPAQEPASSVVLLGAMAALGAVRRSASGPWLMCAAGPASPCIRGGVTPHWCQWQQHERR